MREEEALGLRLSQPVIILIYIEKGVGGESVSGWWDSLGGQVRHTVLCENDGHGEEETSTTDCGEGGGR